MPAAPTLMDWFRRIAGKDVFITSTDTDNDLYRLQYADLIRREERPWKNGMPVVRARLTPAGRKALELLS